MDAKVNWKGKMSFRASADSGFSVDLGADAAVGGDNDGFRPLEMMSVSLAGCTAMDVISILSKKKEDVTAFEVRVHAERAEQHPRVFTSAVITYVLHGHHLDEGSLRRAIELSATRYCPAQAILSKAFPIQLKYEIYEDQAGGKSTLIIGGEVLLPS
jgi:putative redox protein